MNRSVPRWLHILWLVTWFAVQAMPASACVCDHDAGPVEPEPTSASCCMKASESPIASEGSAGPTLSASCCGNHDSLATVVPAVLSGDTLDPHVAVASVSIMPTGTSFLVQPRVLRVVHRPPPPRVPIYLRHAAILR